MSYFKFPERSAWASRFEGSNANILFLVSFHSPPTIFDIDEPVRVFSTREKAVVWLIEDLGCVRQHVEDRPDYFDRFLAPDNDFGDYYTVDAIEYVE